MTKKSFEKGRLTEKLAAAFLKKNKFEILTCNFHSRYGEIDIIAKEGHTICFVEVRARSGEEAHPLETVDFFKRKKIIQTAQFYLSQYKEEKACRFDILFLLQNKKQEWTEHLLRDAFDLTTP
jgi:putative endonuclease